MEKIISFATRCCFLVLLLCSNTLQAQNTDINWLRSVHVGRNTSLDGAMNGITQSAYPVSFAIPAGMLLYGYISDKQQWRHNGWQTVAALGTATIIGYGMKYGIDRKRPYESYPDIVPYHYDTDPSFPSGHTSLAFATATSVSLQYPKWYVVAPAYLWAGAIGYSRMHLGMHYPSDVLAGAVLGAGSSFLAYKGQQWLLKRKQKTAKHPVE
ncbi:MAG TPA: phosphatase PAP2 family protein [Flavipsychrobacter sp.]